MSYEFNPDSPIFEFPNPYKVENVFRIASGSIVIVAGIAGLFLVRERLSGGLDSESIIAVAIVLGLLLLGIWQIAQALMHLRFFFGRNRPVNLAPEVPLDEDGDSDVAGWYKETLRQNAITYPEPQGAVNGLLYSWLPNLIFAPWKIQAATQAAFYNLLSLSATFISFLLCWMLFGQGGASGWIGIAYALFAIPQVLRPVTSLSWSATDTARMNQSAVAFLIVSAILGPALLATFGSSLPDLKDFSINGALAVALLCALLGCAVFGIALKNQLRPAPQAIGSARVTETVTMNAHPNKLLEELDRILMERWFRRIPNRVYTRRSPVVEGESGIFDAEILEETQPRPQTAQVASSIGHALAVPQFRWLVVLSFLALAYSCVGAMAGLGVVKKVLSGEAYASQAALALALVLVGMFCYQASHFLWGRFDFVSELIWVDINGSHESLRMHIGNQISGNVQTSKSVVNIEAMTMRVWVSEIDTVIFGKDGSRQMTGMRGLPAYAGDIAARLKDFGEGRAMVVAPNSPLDLERAQQIGAVNKLVGAAGQEPSLPMESVDLLEKIRKDSIGLKPAQAGAAFAAVQWCTHCGTPLDADARFCTGCGTPVAR